MKRLFVILPLLSLLMACAPMTKTQYLSEYDSFMKEVLEDHKSYTDSDWKQHNGELKEMLENQYPAFEEHMSDEEKIRHWGQAFSYQVYQHKGKVLNELSQNEELYVEMIRENADLLVDVTDDVIKDVLPEIERVLPELKEIGRDVLENLKDKGTLDKLRESAKKLEESLKETLEEVESTQQREL